VSDPGCAVDANGALKHALQIQFYFDADSDIPMAGLPAHPPALSNSTSSLSQGRLDGFVRINGSDKAPASFVAGAHRSGRAVKPSAKIQDATSTIPAKRPAPASSMVVTHRSSYASVETNVDSGVDGRRRNA